MVEEGSGERRARMAANADPRARRTRERLVAAYRQLVDAQDAGSLTVADVVRRAGVNRTSFYAHFADTDQLAVEALTEVFEVVASTDSAGRRDAARSLAEVSEESLAEVARFVFARRGVYGALLDRGDQFATAVEDAFADSALRTLRAGSSRADPVVTARFIAAGVMGVLAWWLRSRQDWTPEQLAEQLAAVIPADFTRRPDA